MKNGPLGSVRCVIEIGDSTRVISGSMNGMLDKNKENRNRIPAKSLAVPMYETRALRNKVSFSFTRTSNLVWLPEPAQ